MSPLIKGLSGPEIERLSMEIIEKELGPTSFTEDELQVVKRIIHATADFDFAKNLRFHPEAIEAGIEAVRQGRPIVADTQMAVSGISSRLLPREGTIVTSPMGTPECRSLASELGGTMAEAAMELAAKMEAGIVVIGNAPTALLKLLDLMKEGNFMPRLVIGVPVGFVNAAESKEELLKRSKVPFITCIGRKGGTPVAVAAINAIIRLAIWPPASGATGS